MNSVEWEEIQTVFHQALERPPAEWEAFVALRLSNPALRDEVLALLAAEQDPASIMSASARAQLEDVNLEGETIGVYRILHRLGSGGMGSVYLAERADGAFEKQVALKVVKKGMDTESVIIRFEQERQILARLDHPNIARVLDGGVTADGRPFFVMEHVDGVPVTEYCDQQRLSISRRLELFRSICGAVQYAHQNLVVHRDLKPSNILVPASGEPKLLDFGIAKLLEAQDTQTLTQAGAVLATPAYAAPEQLIGGSITTATDVYALGVLLYELLAGRRPFESKRTPMEYRELILKGDPIKPSTAITQLPQPDGHDGADTGNRTTTIAAARGAQWQRLRSMLRGDLDTICLTAITREPELRYASAAAFAEDVNRHLRGLPIEARRQSVGYRLSKFYRRHRLGVIASASGVLFAALLAAYHTNRIAAERDLALLEQAKTQEVVEFVTGLFHAADPAQARGADVTARELLDAGLQQIETEMTNHPEVQATMKRVLGEVYYELGLQEPAGELLQSALDSQRRLYGESHLETAKTLLSLGMQQQTVGDMEAAADSFDRALAVRRELLGASHEDVLAALSAEAFFEETDGNYARAESLHQQALAMARALADSPDDLLIAEQMAKYASVLRLQDRIAEAEIFLREALGIQDRVYGGAHPVSDETKRQLAELLTDRRRFDEAEILYKQLIESRTSMLGPDHYETGAAWNSYGHLLNARGDTHGAIDAYNRMLTITRTSYGDTHPALAAGYNNVALMQRNLGNLDEALEGFALCLQMQDAVDLPADHPNRAYPVAGLARVYLLQGRFLDAEVEINRALALRAPQLAPDHILIVELQSDLGAVLTEQGRYDEAEAPLLTAYRELSSNWGADDPRTRLTAARIVRFYERSGQPDAAAPFRASASKPEDEVMLRYF